MQPISDDVLDEILAIQFIVAWAGEGRCEPERLGWWDTDVVDELGGGDFMKRLVPRTHAWAALQAVREAARRKDEEIRSKAADPDRVRSLFHLGHDVERQLDDRLAELKKQGGEPSNMLPMLDVVDADFDADELAATLEEKGDADVEQTPGGRRVRGDMPDDPRVAVQNLAAALIPFEEHYPQPHYRRR